MRFKHLIPIAISLLMVLATTPAEARKIKIATVSPDGTDWMIKMRAGGEEIEKLTKGRIKFKFYPGGVMGDDRSVRRKIRVGQLHGASVTGGTLGHYFKDSQIYGMPLKFRNMDEVDYVRKFMDERIVKGVEEGGLVTFGLGGGGLAYVMGKMPTLTVADLRSQKVWIPDNDENALTILQAFEVTPIPLALADVLVGLQTDLIDTVGISPIGALAFQWHTQITSVTEVPLLYLYAVLGIDQKTFKKIKPGDQQIIRDVMGKVFKEIDDQNRTDNNDALETLRSRGIKVSKPTPEEVARWNKIAEASSKKLVEAGNISAEAMAELDKHLADFRAHKTAN